MIDNKIIYKALISIITIFLLCYTAIAENIYFAGQKPPQKDIPPEAPLCYKLQVSSLEEQLGNLKAKYGNGLSYYNILKDDYNESRVLEVTIPTETKTADDNTLSYRYLAHYFESAAECNEYQQKHLEERYKEFYSYDTFSNPVKPPKAVLKLIAKNQAVAVGVYWMAVLFQDYLQNMKLPIYT